MSLRKEKVRQPNVLWHGTSSSVIEDIKREGLKCACSPAAGATSEYCDVYDALGVVCLTDNVKNARFYSIVSTVLARHLSVDEMVVVKVDEGKLDRDKLVKRKSVDKVNVLSGGEYDYLEDISPDALTFYKWNSKAKDFIKVV